jgi:hypothetical protein
MKKRLIDFVSYKELGQNKFEEVCGIANGTISNMRDNMTVKTLMRISKAYPDLNVNWLLTGEGDMLYLDNASIIGSNVQQNHVKNGKNLSFHQEISPETISENSKNYQDIIKKQQEQIDRMLSIIEKLTNQ